MNVPHQEEGAFIRFRESLSCLNVDRIVTLSCASLIPLRNTQLVNLHLHLALWFPLSSLEHLVYAEKLRIYLLRGYYFQKQVLQVDRARWQERGR